MTVENLCDKLQLEYLCGESFKSTKEVNGCYCGDLLSWVMSKAEPGNVWLTVMGNINSIGVAVLTEISCIILTENAPLDDDAKKRADDNGVIVLKSSESAYRLAAKISDII